MSDFFPTRLPEFVNWFKGFIECIVKHNDVIKLPQQAVDEINDKYLAMKTADVEVREAKNRYKAAISAKDSIRKQSVNIIRQNSAVIHANRSIPSQILKELGLQPHKKKRSYEEPRVPTHMFVKPVNLNTNLITWKANGNIRHTMYILQVKHPEDDDFKYLESTHATKFKHITDEPGKPSLYRVLAVRRGKKSTYSVVAAANLR